MSALDLFAGAMGAFILIMLILLPYYLKGTPAPPEPQECPELPASPICPVCPTPGPIPSCPAPAPPSPPTVKLKDNLLVVQMEWNQRVDVDLYIKTPDGTFSYSRKTIPGKPGKMTLDNTSGGDSSLEIWMSYAPTPGRYKVCFKNLGSNSVTVKGRLDKPSGPIAIPRVSVSAGGKRCPLNFKITPNYEYQRL